jgi:D-3-phosphoglycerate dehydrogenase
MVKMKGMVLVTERDSTHEDAIKMLEMAGFSVDFAGSPDLNEPGNSKKLENADALLVNVFTSVDKNILGNAKNLKAIIACCAGTDKIDMDECRKRGIKIYNSPGANANAVAEHTVALMFAVLRKLLEADKTTRDGKWERMKFLSYELNGKTVGIAGFGAIGKLVAKKLQGFGVDILAYDPFLAEAQIGNEDLKVRKVSDIRDLLKESDIVTIHVPLSEKTKHLIGKKELGLMKKNAILINTSRGAVVNEQALVDALKSKKIYGAGLDVFENEPPAGSELLKLKNTVITPHIAAMTEEAFRSMCMLAVEMFLMDR